MLNQQSIDNLQRILFIINKNLTGQFDTLKFLDATLDLAAAVEKQDEALLQFLNQFEQSDKSQLNPRTITHLQNCKNSLTLLLKSYKKDQTLVLIAGKISNLINLLLTKFETPDTHIFLDYNIDIFRWFNLPSIKVPKSILAKKSTSDLHKLKDSNLLVQYRNAARDLSKHYFDNLSPELNSKIEKLGDYTVAAELSEIESVEKMVTVFDPIATQVAKELKIDKASATLWLLYGHTQGYCALFTDYLTRKKVDTQNLQKNLQGLQGITHPKSTKESKVKKEIEIPINSLHCSTNISSSQHGLVHTYGLAINNFSSDNISFTTRDNNLPFAIIEPQFVLNSTHDQAVELKQVEIFCFHPAATYIISEDFILADTIVVPPNNAHVD